MAMVDTMYGQSSIVAGGTRHDYCDVIVVDQQSSVHGWITIFKATATCLAATGAVQDGPNERARIPLFIIHSAQIAATLGTLNQWCTWHGDIIVMDNSPDITTIITSSDIAAIFERASPVDQ